MDTFPLLAKTLLTRFLMLMLLAASLALPASAIDLPKPSSRFYISDLAKIIPKKTSDYIVNINKNLKDKTGAQVVVATVDTLHGNDLEAYATALFRAWGIGDRTKNNGVLFLIVKNDRKLRIEVGYGLEGAINDAKAGRILDTYVIPYLKNDQWEEGIVNGFNAILQEVKTEYPSDVQFNTPKAAPRATACFEVICENFL